MRVTCALVWTVCSTSGKLESHAADVAGAGTKRSEGKIQQTLRKVDRWDLHRPQAGRAPGVGPLRVPGG